MAKEDYKQFVEKGILRYLSGKYEIKCLANDGNYYWVTIYKLPAPDKIESFRPRKTNSKNLSVKEEFFRLWSKILSDPDKFKLYEEGIIKYSSRKDYCLVKIHGEYKEIEISIVSKTPTCRIRNNFEDIPYDDITPNGNVLEFNNVKIICPTKEQLEEASKRSVLHFANKRKCKICDSEFDFAPKGGTSKTTCGLCKIQVKCKICKKEFTLNLKNLSGQQQIKILDNIKNRNELNILCSSSCRSKSRMASGVCSKCGKYSDNRNVFGVCRDCTAKNLSTIVKNNSGDGNCLKCDKYSTNRNASGLCPTCVSNSMKMIAISKTKEGICKSCGEFADKRNGFGICNKCSGIESIYQRENDRITHIKGKIIDDFFGFKTTGFYLNKTENKITSNDQVVCRWKNKGFEVLPLTEEEYKNFHNIYQREDGRITHINNVPIEDICTSIISRLDFDIESKYPGFFIKTGLPRDYVGDFIGKEAFDQSLCNLGVGYFVYIKFYNCNGVRKPLAVCKSSTKLVSDGINDVSFSYYNKKQTASRQFLEDNGFNWWTEEIYVIPISKEDYNEGNHSITEQEIAKKYNLFY